MEIDEETTVIDQVDTIKTTYHFFAGNPKVEITRGKVHLFPLKPDKSTKTTNTEREGLSTSDEFSPPLDDVYLPNDRKNIILVLSVPCYMSVGEFVSFTGPFAAKMKHIRILRDNSLNSYKLLILFESQKDADAFHLQKNQTNYNSMSPEVCRTAFVKKVKFIHPKNANLFPPTGQIEIPTCSICLEKLDSSVSGLLTILCNHSFHFACLIGWRAENRCPICRYTQIPTGEDSVCEECGYGEGLMFCLNCGHVGCTRSKHSEEHFDKKQHVYALNLDNEKVWNFTRKQYVRNRLVTNYLDGKIVEIPDSDWETDIANTLKHTDLGLDEDEKLQLEWEYLLEAHLASQRKEFEDRIVDIEKHNYSKIKYLEEEYARLLEEKLDTGKKIDQFEKQKKNLEKRSKELEKKMNDIANETNFLKEINVAMVTNQNEWEQKVQETEEKLKQCSSVESKDEKIQELEEQIRDLIFYIEAQKGLANQSELEDGQVVVVQSPSSLPKSSTQSGRTKRKSRITTTTTTTAMPSSTTSNTTQPNAPKSNQGGKKGKRGKRKK